MGSPDKAVDSKLATRDAGEALEVVLPPGLEAPGAVREEVTRWLSGRVGGQVLGDVLLVTSELVTNSVRHASGGPGDVIRVRAQAAIGRLRLEVEDGGRHGDVAIRVPDSDRAGGFGLNVVDALALRWGVSRGDRTRVWAEFADAADDV
jgi:anti-sigma regulatory factor (Ser/Thr protein kinase)